MTRPVISLCKESLYKAKLKRRIFLDRIFLDVPKFHNFPPTVLPPSLSHLTNVQKPINKTVILLPFGWENDLVPGTGPWLTPKVSIWACKFFLYNYQIGIGPQILQHENRNQLKLVTWFTDPYSWFWKPY